LFETGLEIFRLMEQESETERTFGGIEVEKLMDGAILVTNDNGILIAIDKSVAQEKLSQDAITLGQTKGLFLCYSGVAVAIPLFELSKSHEGVRDFIVNEESLRATLCVNFPEYVNAHNMNALPDEQIEGEDSPPNLFLQKQLDNAAYGTRLEVEEFLHTHENESDRGYGLFDDVLDFER
jgi:hypothetical protein